MLIGAALLALSVIVGKAGSRFGMPTLLMFLGIGMLAGVDGFGLRFDNVATAQFIGMVALCIILFSGGMDTKISQIRPIAAPGIVLATVGVLLTTILTGAFIYSICHWVVPGLNFGIAESLLLAATMSSTDSASVFSILSTTRTGLKQNLRPLLELESGSNDPMAYLLVIILIGVIEGGGTLTSAIVGDASIMLVVQLVLGTLGGAVIGWLSVKVINHLRIDNELLYPVMMIACVFFTFSLTELVGGNSYLAVYVAGLVVGNSRMAMKRSIGTFFGGFTWLVQIIMFLSLGLLVNPGEMLEMKVWIPGVCLGVFLIIVARPVAVFLCLIPFRKFTTKAKLYISWVGLRGAVPIIFATYAVISPAVEHGTAMFNMVFFITLLSLLVQGTTVKKMASWLGLTEPIEERKFNIDLPDDVAATLKELTVDPQMLSNGNTIKDINLPKGELVMMIRRKDTDVVVPRGDTLLYPGDTLLTIRQDVVICTDKDNTKRRKFTL